MDCEAATQESERGWFTSPGCQLRIEDIYHLELPLGVVDSCSYADDGQGVYVRKLCMSWKGLVEWRFAYQDVGVQPKYEIRLILRASRASSHGKAEASSQHFQSNEPSIQLAIYF